MIRAKTCNDLGKGGEEDLHNIVTFERQGRDGRQNTSSGLKMIGGA